MWIKTTDKLPPENKYVLARNNRSNHYEKDDPENVNCVVVKLKKGLSEEDRFKMKIGEFPDIFNDIIKKKRSEIYYSEDEWGNNLLPYNWVSFGGDSFFAQEIVCWMEIPK